MPTVTSSEAFYTKDTIKLQFLGKNASWEGKYFEGCVVETLINQRNSCCGEVIVDMQNLSKATAHSRPLKAEKIF